MTALVRYVQVILGGRLTPFTRMLLGNRTLLDLIISMLGCPVMLLVDRLSGCVMLATIVFGPIRTTLSICPLVFEAVAMTVLTLGSVLLGAVVMQTPVCGPLSLTLVPRVSSPVVLGSITYNLL